MPTKAQSAWNKVALLEVLEADFQSGRKSADNVGIQKLMFLTELEGRRKNLKAAYYRFYRFKHGPLSTELLNDVIYLEKFNFIDSESRELLDRGRYLLEYLNPEIEESALAKEVIGIAQATATSWRDYRGWNIVPKIYELSVPVDGMQSVKMNIGEIPLNTDILVPDWSHEREVQPFSADTISDIQSELSIPWTDLDPLSEDVWAKASASLMASFNR